MCKTAEEIRATDYTCITLDRYIVQRKKDINGDSNDKYAEYDIMKTEAEIHNRIGLVQIQEDLQPLAEHAKNCTENPSLVKMFKTNFLKTSGAVALIGFFIFMIFYTFVEVVGYAEALTIFK